MSQDGGVFASQVIEVNRTQSLKALQPMLVTLLPIMTDVRPEQFLKASLPMLVTLLPIMTDVRPEQL